MHTIRFLSNLIESHQILACTILFVGILLEGEFTLMISGILAHLGAIHFGLALSIGLSGAVVKTVLGYYIGGIIKEKYPNSRFFKHLEKKVAYILPKFKQSPFWSIFASKFIIGINHFTLVFSGYFKINYRTYLKAEFISTIIWVIGMLSIGYFFSYTAFQISQEIRKFTIIIILFLIGFFILEKILSFIYELFEETDAEDK